MAGEDQPQGDQRISVVEANVKHLERSIGNIGESITDGFRDVRKAVSDGLTEVHRRVDNVEQRSQTSWPLVIAFITLGFTCMGALVAFIVMTVEPVKEMAHTNVGSLRTLHDQEVAAADMRGYYRAKIEDGETRIVNLENIVLESIKADSASTEHRRNMERWIGHIDNIGPRGLCYECSKSKGDTK